MKKPKPKDKDAIEGRLYELRDQTEKAMEYAATYRRLWQQEYRKFHKLEERQRRVAESLDVFLANFETKYERGGLDCLALTSMIAQLRGRADE